ncbi:MAG: outer membrane protein transport protein [Pseudomonadota bacterium]|nr:outer membrane protein transport protein [Pseudomonadota bacterium]
MKRQSFWALLANGLFFFVLSNPVYAAGFESQSLSTSGLGTANASASVFGYDASNQFANPATLADIKKATITFGGQVIMPDIEFTNDGSQYATGQPIEGEGGADLSSLYLVPSLYMATPISESLAYGISFNTPFASRTSYDNSWVGRFHSTDSKITAYNINPALAVKVLDSLNLGFGFSLQYADASLTSAFNSYLACISTLVDLGSAYSDAVAACAPVAGEEGEQKLTGDSWSAGWNIGATFQPLQSLRLAVDYRSAVFHDLEGKVEFSDTSGDNPLVATGAFINAPAQLDLDLPESFSIALMLSLSQSVDLMVDYSWMGWSSIERFVIQYDSNQRDTVLPQNWKDTYRIAAGLEYQVTPKARFRFGMAFDESPITEDQYRSPRVPDSDRTWLSFGMNYLAFENVDLDFGYTYIQSASAKTENVSPTQEVLIGKFDSSAHLLGAQLNWRF